MKNKKEFLDSIFQIPHDVANRTVKVSRNYKYVLFLATTVGDIFLKKQLLQLEQLAVNQEDSPDDAPSKAVRLAAPLQLQAALRYHLNNFFTFAFVQNPYSRLLSFYLKQLCDNEETQKTFLPKLGQEPDAKISFEAFLQAIQAQGINDMNINWLPQHILLAADTVDLDFIGKFEHFKKDFLKVLVRITSNPKQAKQIADQTPKRQSIKEIHIEKHLTPEAAQLIKDIYYEDFKYYGYGFDYSMV